MNTRRNFIKACGALAVGAILPATIEAKAVPGETYFNAFTGPRLPDGKRLYVDGDDCTMWTCEANLLEGWVLAYQHKITASGDVELLHNPAFCEFRNGKWIAPEQPRKYRLYGKVEVR